MSGAKDIEDEDEDVTAPSAHSLGASYQATAATSSGGMRESGESLIHGSEVDRVKSHLLPRDTTTELGGPRSAVPEPGKPECVTTQQTQLLVDDFGQPLILRSYTRGIVAPELVPHGWQALQI